MIWCQNYTETGGDLNIIKTDGLMNVKRRIVGARRRAMSHGDLILSDGFKTPKSTIKKGVVNNMKGRKQRKPKIDPKQPKISEVTWHKSKEEAEDRSLTQKSTPDSKHE